MSRRFDVRIFDDPYTEPTKEQRERMKAWYAEGLFNHLKYNLKAEYLLFDISNNDSYGGEC